MIYINNPGDGIKSRVRSLFPDDTILYSATKIPTYSTQLQGDLRILEFWERWQLVSSNIEKCHQLTVTKKRNRIPTSYTLHNQTLERVTSAKYLELELTENFHGGKHIQPTAAKANKVSGFAYKNLNGSPSAVQTHCYKRPYASSAGERICDVGTPSAT